MSSQTQYPDLAGKAVFITGGATGIGAELVRAFSLQGASVGFIDLNEKAGQKLAESLKEDSDGETWFQEVDASDPTPLKGAVSEFAGAMGRLDVLINNVANDQRHNFQTVSAESLSGLLAVNLEAAFFAAQASIPFLKKIGGAIINIGSINYLSPDSDLSVYVTAKAGLVGLTRNLAQEFGQHNIRSNIVIPGWVVTKKQLETVLTTQAEAEWMQKTPLQKRLLPADIANLIKFLASDDAKMITGQEFIIDGGRTLA